MSEQKWKNFEALVAKIQKDLSPEAKVVLSEKITGKLTGAKRQVDVAIRQSIGQYNIFIAIECKDYKRPVNVKGVEASIGLFDDVGANQAVIVAAKGFSAAAKARGNQAGLKLYSLVDTGDHDWKSNLVVPAFCTLIRLHSFSLQITGVGDLIFPVEPSEMAVLEIYDESEIYVGTVKDLLYQRWHNHEISLEPGITDYIDFIGMPIKYKYGVDLFNATISASLDIRKELYFNNLTITEMSGFKDEYNGAIISKGMTLADISLDIIKKDWEKIDNEEQLAVKPIVKFTLLA